MVRGIKRIGPAGTKWCPGCKDFLDIHRFSASSAKRDGLNWACRSCLSVRSKRRYANNPDVPIDRQYHYNYGIDGDTYREMLKQQGGCCLVCGRGETRLFKGKIKRLSVDHCHKTKKVRGLLCGECNSALGLLGDDKERIQSLLNYVSRDEPVLKEELSLTIVL